MGAWCPDAAIDLRIDCISESIKSHTSIKVGFERLFLSLTMKEKMGGTCQYVE